MRRFVAEQNIRRFKRMLEEEMDSGQNTLLRDLLTEAEQELAEATQEFEALEEAARLGDAVDSDEVGPVIQLEAGHCSETKPATVAT